ncbi:hypothetical protein BKA81DRAFT_27144 [Phyllosticta paracitricarpa]|uniref:Uncharacterized protein n=1 Tax=Phyllosticta paracitricarpa TaxID=2016321 RepID=A0ABR1NIU4_9PEZI
MRSLVMWETLRASVSLTSQFPHKRFGLSGFGEHAMSKALRREAGSQKNKTASLLAIKRWTGGREGEDRAICDRRADKAATTQKVSQLPDRPRPIPSDSAESLNASSPPRSSSNNNSRAVCATRTKKGRRTSPSYHVAMWPYHSLTISPLSIIPPPHHTTSTAAEGTRKRPVEPKSRRARAVLPTSIWRQEAPCEKSDDIGQGG